MPLTASQKRNWTALAILGAAELAQREWFNQRRLSRIPLYDYRFA
jgi:hypothetical protein